MLLCKNFINFANDFLIFYMTKRAFIIVLIDFLVVSFAFLVMAWIKRATLSYYIPYYSEPLVIFLIIRSFIMLIFIKEFNKKYNTRLELLKIVGGINFLSLAIVSILSVAYAVSVIYSRKIIFGTIAFTFIIESFFSLFYLFLLNMSEKGVNETEEIAIVPDVINNQISAQKEAYIIDSESKEQLRFREIIIEESGAAVYKFIASRICLKSDETSLLSTTTRFNVINQPFDSYKNIINLKRVNDTRYINKFLEAINDKLVNGGLFLGCGETYSQRYIRLIKPLPIVFRHVFFGFDFIFQRIFPKVPVLKKLYFFFTLGRRRPLSKAEILGRLASCGFEILEVEEINNKLYFLGRKIRLPHYDLNPSYGPLFKMRRIGKGGEIIKVYKFRTMHPYAEYLHDYILMNNGYSEIGKPADDFRLTNWGKIMRKYWLDELPQLINVIKGEMKLVGARPLSQRVYNDYPEDIKKIRDKYKPGCFPPYVALLMQNMEASIEAERIYLLEKQKNPYTTDFKYFCKSVYNILTNKIRSA